MHAYRRIGLAVILSAAALSCPAAASAATINVTTNVDGTGSGSCPAAPCTLRQAITFASSGDTISVPGATYTLTPANGPLSINKTLTITGAGATTTTVTQSGSIQLMNVDDDGLVTVSGINFKGGVAATSGTGGGTGGAIETSGVLTIADAAFTNNSANGGAFSGANTGRGGIGGAIYNTGVLTVTGSSFGGNAAHGGAGSPTGNGGGGGSGGAIYSESVGRLSIGTSTFDNNVANPGTAGGSVTAYSPNAGEGGAIWASGSVALSNNTFGATTLNQALGGVYADSNNGQAGQGGAVYLDYSSARLTGNTFTANQATGGQTGPSYGNGGDGGALYVYYGRVLITGGSFGSGNVAQGSSTGGAGYGGGGAGGAIYEYYGTLTLNGPMTFNGATANGGVAGATNGGNGGSGGAIYSYGALTMSNITFTGSAANAGTSTGTHGGGAGEGGAVYAEGAVTLSGSTFTGNMAKAQSSTNSYGAYGGAMYISDGSAVITGTTFNANTAVGGTSSGAYGGAVYMDGSSLGISASAFTSNVAGSTGPSISPYGGALYAESGGTSVDTSTFTGNTAAHGSGGAAYSTSSLRIMTSTLNGNTADYGGGFYSDGADAVVNSTIDQNTGAQEGGGIYSAEVLALANVTLVNNTAGTAAGGGNLYLDSGSVTSHDSIIAGGLLSTGSGNENCFTYGPLAMDSLGYNIDDRNQCGFAGPGDKINTGDPKLGPLAPNGGPTQTVALVAGSPAIDAGDPAGCSDDDGVALAADQRGISRPQGARCDIGAFELQQTPPPIQPAISGLKVSPTSFAPDKHGATISKATPHGTTVSYTDSEAAKTTFTIVGKFKGYRAHGKGACKALPKSGKAPKHSKKCTRTVNTGSFSHTDVAGANTFHFSGRLKGKGLPKGSYTATTVPQFSGLTGHAATVKFKII